MKRKFRDCFSFEPKFYMLNKSDSSVVAVENESDNGYTGVIISFGFGADSTPNWGYDPSPFYIAKTFISQMLVKYDFTLEEKYAELHLVE